MSKRRLWLSIIAVVAVLAIGAYFVANGRGDKTIYRFDKVDRGDIVVSISATGTLNADTTVDVGSQVSGRIAKIYVDFNSVVKRGQLLAQLDPTFLDAALNQAKAGTARAQATLNQTERDYNRTKDLFAKGLVSQADMDAAIASYESAKAGLQQAQATQEGAEVNLRYATITSPISGVVISRNVDVGQTVAASLSAPTLFQIANDLKKMQVQASVHEADIGNVRAGQHVTFRVDAYPDDKFEGIVTQVRLAPVITQNVVNYTVIIDVRNPDLKLMPGMTATVSIEVDKRHDVLRVPIQAIRFTPPDEPKETRASDESKTQNNGSASDSSRGERRWANRGQTSSGERGGEGRGRWKQVSDSTREGRGSDKPPAKTVRATVWMMDGSKLKPVTIVRGLMNTQYAEVVEGDVKDGDQVIIGAISTQSQAASGTQNPFQPRMPGGGGRRGF